MKIFADQLGRTIQLPDFPQRIVSVVPSQTELLHHLGLEGRVVGITKFCVHPSDWYRNKTRVGGTKKLKLDKIRALQPDLIIANKEENDQAQIEELMQEFPVWISDIETVTDALAMIQGVGHVTGTVASAYRQVSRIRMAFKEIPELSNTPTAYFIWRKPWMVAGHSTYIDDLLKHCGMVNVFADRPSRYPEVSNEEVMAARPGLILLSSEPYPFKEQHMAELRALCPQAMILLVDGEMFSWYGSRMVEAAEYLKDLIGTLGNGSVR